MASVTFTLYFPVLPSPCNEPADLVKYILWICRYLPGVLILKHPILSFGQRADVNTKRFAAMNPFCLKHCKAFKTAGPGALSPAFPPYMLDICPALLIVRDISGTYPGHMRDI